MKKASTVLVTGVWQNLSLLFGQHKLFAQSFGAPASPCVAPWREVRGFRSVAVDTELLVTEVSIHRGGT